MVLKKAAIGDFEIIMNLIQGAKAYLKSQGIDQWQSGYPGKEDIVQDIETQNGYILVDKEKIAGYACISFGGEKSYETLQGRWQNQGPYAVIHRMTIDSSHKGKGFANLMLKFAEELCLQNGVNCIKADTHPDNETMKHILSKNGYAYRGKIKFDNGDKIAFEKSF